MYSLKTSQVYSRWKEFPHSTFFYPGVFVFPQPYLLQEREAAAVQIQEDFKEQSVSHSIQTWRLAVATFGHRREYTKVGGFRPRFDRFIEGEFNDIATVMPKKFVQKNKK